MREGPFGLRWFWPAVVGVLAATLIVAGGLMAARQAATASAASAAAATYTPPPAGAAALRSTVSTVGDSYTSGSAMDSGDSALWWGKLTSEMPVRFDVFAVGGSGYSTVSTASDKTTFVDRATEVNPNSSEVVFFGSRNDSGAAAGEYVQDARKALAAARRAAPEARLIVIGPPWVDSNPPVALLAKRDALRKEAAAAGAVWVDPMAQDWFPTGSGLIGADGVHPTDAGHQHLADLIGPILGKYLPRKG